MEVKFLNTGGYGKIGRVICFIYDKNGKPFNGDPRQILAKTIKKYGKQDYSMFAAFELEFFMLRKNSAGEYVPADDTGYFGVAPLDTADYIKREMALTMEMHGFEVEAFHKEVAKGQHEINYKYSSCLESADKVLTAK
jgi:glutamine synthetase